MKAAAFSLLILASSFSQLSGATTWQVADTGQDFCYDESKPITPPKPAGRFYGQDAQYAGATPSYRDNGDGTITDLVTGLIWAKAVDPRKVNLVEAKAIAKGMTLGGHSDWRVPTIKELYSLIDFRGVTGATPPGDFSKVPATAIPYINTDFFDFLYGDTKAGERYIDAQWLSSTPYTGTTMRGMETLFGVNFADGRIKGYGLRGPDGREKKFYARYVRGDAYGQNDFADNGDGTITDRATGLIWAKADSGRSMTWEEALRYADGAKIGQEDWRLPNAKELQSLADYARSPDATSSPAIDPVFETTAITNEAGQKDWPFFWASTTHLDGPNARNAVYVAFGRALGSMHGQVLDVHGAGSQRSDPKVGEARLGHGPQGDAQRVKNFVRCVRGGNVTLKENPTRIENNPAKYPNTIRVAGQAKKPAPIDFSKPAQASESQGLPPNQMPGQQQASGQSQMMPGPGGQQPSGEDFIKRLDRNGDGKVSRSEFDGPREHFKDFDKNRDNAITADEAPTGPPPSGPGGQQGPRGGGQQRQPR